MEKNLLIGNGINIQFGGKEIYSGKAIMNRIIDNIKNDKYTRLTDNSLSIDEQMGIFEGLVCMIDKIKSGKMKSNADGLFMFMELERIERNYPEKSSVDSVNLEDYFLAFEILNNGYREQDGEKQNEKYMQIMFRFLRQVMVDGIYNNGHINQVHKNFYPKMARYLNGFSKIFTTNYDYNIENILENSKSVCHLHGEFDVLSPEYDDKSIYYKSNKSECDELIKNRVVGMDHIYSNAVMSWYWLDKYGKMMEDDMKLKEALFRSISGKLEIVGLSPTNDEHLFIMINQNPKISSVVYYYKDEEEKMEIPRHIKKHITYAKVDKLWDSMR